MPNPNKKNNKSAKQLALEALYEKNLAKDEEKKKNSPSTNSTKNTKKPVKSQSGGSQGHTNDRRVGGAATSRAKEGRQTIYERTKGTLKGAGKQWLGGQLSGVATAAQFLEPTARGIIHTNYKEPENRYNLRSREDAEYREQNYLDENVRRKEGRDINNARRYYANPNENLQNLVNQADELMMSGQEDIDKAKEGAGALGKVMIDLGANAAQMTGDMSMNYILPGLGMLSLMNRASGGAGMEGRQIGMDVNQQMAYAAGTGMIEGLSEGIFNSVGAFRAAYGKGAIDLAGRISNKTAATNIVQNYFKTEAGQILAYNLAKMGGGMLEEGTEEIVAGIAEPALKYVLLKASDPNQEWEGYDWKELGYDFMIGAMMGGMGGSIDMARNTADDLRLSQSQAFKDGVEYTKKFINEARATGRLNENGKTVKNTAEVLADQFEQQINEGKKILPGQARMLQEAVAEQNAQNDEAFTSRRRTEYQKAVSEGRADTVESRGSAEEETEFRRGVQSTQKANTEAARKAMGEDASKESVEALGRVMTGSADSYDHNIILKDQKAREAFETLTGEKLSLKNTEARDTLEKFTSVNEIANRDKILAEAHENIRTNMGVRGGKLFKENYDEAVKAIGTKNAPEIYESVFSRLYSNGMVENAKFEDVYDRVIGQMQGSLKESVDRFFTKEMALKVFNEGRSVMYENNARKTALNVAQAASKTASGFTIESNVKGKVTKKQERLLASFAEKAKVHIHLVDSIANGTANGAYKDGVIYIAADASNKLITVAKHELTHHLKATSPARYQELEDFVFERWYEGDAEAMEETVRDYQQRYNCKPEEAREEIIADAAESFFTDKAAINDAIDFSRSLGKAIHKGIRSLLNDFLEIQKSDNKSERGYGDFLEDLDILKDAEEMWLDALNESTKAREDKVTTRKQRVKAKADLDNFLKENNLKKLTQPKLSKKVVEDSNGNGLSIGQQDFFEDSKAVDNEGRLAVVYHTTDKGGFTVFDPLKSDDKRSLFFASNFDVSQTYSRRGQAGATREFTFPKKKNYKSFEAFSKDFKRISGEDVMDLLRIQIRDKTTDRISTKLGSTDEERFKTWLDMAKAGDDVSNYYVDMDSPDFLYGWNAHDIYVNNLQDLLSNLSDAMSNEEPSGHYACYLNLENPLVVDGKGANWSAIPYVAEESKQAQDKVFDAYDRMLNDADIRISEVVIRRTANRRGDGKRTLYGVELIVHGNKIIDGHNGEVIDFNKTFKYNDDTLFSELPLGASYDTDYYENARVMEGVIKRRINDALLDEVTKYFKKKTGLSDKSIKYLFKKAWKTDVQYGFPEHAFLNEPTYTAFGERKIVDLPYVVEDFGKGLFDSNGDPLFAPKYISQDDIDKARKTLITGKHNTRGLAKLAERNGYDGVIIKNITDIGGSSSLKRGASKYSDIYIAFNSEQVKLTSNENPTADKDIRFSVKAKEEMEEIGATVTEGGTVARYSLKSWNDTDKKKLLQNLMDAGFPEKDAKKWIRQVNSVASIIYGDMARLDYEADAYQDALKPNSEYFYTLDLSTLCAKRRLYQGTYNAIMKRLPNRAMMPEDTVRLRKMMKDMKHEVPCGICYEESRKKNEGKFAEIWLNGQSDKSWEQALKEYNKKLEKYKKKLDQYNALENKGNKKPPKEPKKPERWMGYANMEHDDPFIPTLADVTTTTGRDALRENHPEALEAYLEYQKGRGSANPKVSFTHTDYRGDILRMTDKDIENVKHIGGLRIQSFSDFETVHVIDMMQAVMDMASRKLTSQAYTKVPAFADIFGGTGIKINLSLIGMVKNGKLVFDSTEGIDPKEAFRLRKKYSKNVGTIIVGANVESILAAWADSRIDMVIPFHRSGWSTEEFEQLGLGDYEDFQEYQTERYLDGSSPNGISLADAKMQEIYSEDYWDYNKTGKENAEAYLKLCAEKHYRPVFYNFLHDNGDGTWSLQEDGSTDGYWKSLVDYKMYDNEGNGAPQAEVQPIFDMRAARKVMDQFDGDPNTLPVAEDVVDKFVEEYKEDGKYSVSEVASGATASPSSRDIMSKEDIRIMLKENFNEYEKDEENLKIATDAVYDLQHSTIVRGNSLAGQGRGLVGDSQTKATDDSGRLSDVSTAQIRTIAKGITTKYVKEGYVEFRGEKVNSPEELAELCQILRDPRFETMRLVLTKGNTIVSFLSISSRLPSQSKAFEKEDIGESIKAVRNRMKRTGADGYYIIHNHPSGNVRASQGDLVQTARYIVGLGSQGYKGHIILDHNKYGLIEDIPQRVGSMILPTAKEAILPRQRAIDIPHVPEIAHPVLGEQISGGTDLARIGKSVNTTNDYSVLVYMNAQGMVTGVQEIYNKTLRNNKEIKGFIRNQAVDFGADRVGLFLTSKDPLTTRAGLNLYHDGVLIDMVYELQGSTVGAHGYISRRGSADAFGLSDSEVRARTRVFESIAGVDDYASKDELKYSRKEGDNGYTDVKQLNEAIWKKNEQISVERWRAEVDAQKIKNHYNEVQQAKRERREESETRTKLLNIARRLSKIKTNDPTRQLIDSLIGDLDLIAKSMTGKSLQKLYDLSEWYDEQCQADAYFYDENIEKALDRVAKKQIADMDIDDVRDLIDILKAIETSIRNGNKFVDSQYKKTMHEAGLEVIKDVDESVGIKRTTVLGKLDAFFINGTLSPERQIRRVTGYKDDDPMYIATKELSKGQRDMLTYQMTSWDMFKKFTSDKNFVKSLNGKNAREIVLYGQVKGENTEIKVTPDIAISLYLSSLNKDNMYHIGKGGVNIPDFAAYRKGNLEEAYDNTTRVTFSKGQLERIRTMLTAQEREFTDKAYEYYNKVAPDAINEVSNILKGYSLARVNNYFPINVDQNFLEKDFESLKFDGTIEGMGSLKERVKSGVPIEINGIVNTLTRSIQENSMYVGLAIPVRNFNKLLGVKDMKYTEKDRGGKMELDVSYEGSVNESIRKKWGKPTMKYIEKFMTDLQTNRRSGDDWENMLNRLRSNYAGAVLTLNLSVAMKQAASYPTAIAVLGTWPAIRAMGNLGKVNLDLIAKYTPLQWYRSQGYSVKELGDIKAGRKDSFIDKVTSKPFLNWIQAMDVLTTRKLWKASEYYVRQHNKNLKAGTDDYYKVVAEVYNRVIEETQPNYTVMQRPDLLRADSFVTQTLNMFKTQPYQNFNILYDSVGNYIAKAKQYKGEKSAENKAKVKEAYVNMNNAVWSQFLQLATFASMTFAWAFFRGKDDKWKDEEEDKVTLLSFLKRLGIEMTSGSSAMIPLGADLYSLLTHNATGDYYSGFQSITDSSINDLFNTATDLTSLIGKAMDYYNAEDKSDIDTDAIWKQLEKVIKEWGRFAGVPAQNMWNLFDATYRWVMIAANGKYVGEYESLKETLASEKVKKQLLLKAYNNDIEAYREIRQRMIEDGFDVEKINKYMGEYEKTELYDAYNNDPQRYEEIRSLMLEEGYTEEDLDNLLKKSNKESLTEESDSDINNPFSESMASIEGYDIWNDASDGSKEYYTDILNKLSLGIEDQKTGYVTEKAVNGLTEEQVILYKLAVKQADAKNDGNGSYKKSEKEEALRMLEEAYGITLTEEQKEILMD